MNGRRILIVALLALVVGLFPFLARSAGAAPIGTTGRPQSPAVAQSCCDGSHLVVWAEDRGKGTLLDLYGARLNSAGIVAGSEVPILVAPGNQGDPTLAFSRRNNAYLLVYTNDAGPTQPTNPTPGIPTPPGPPGLPTPPGPPGLPTSVLPTPPHPLAGEVATGWIGPAVSLDSSAVSLASSLALVAIDSQPDQLPTPPIPPGVTATAPLPPGVTPTAGPTPTPDPNAPPAPPSTTGARDLYGMWVSPGGIRVTQTFGIVTSPADDTYPDLGYVQYENGDQFALVWREVTGTAASIAVMRLDGLGYYFAVNAKATVLSGGDLGRPSVAGEQTAGEYFVVWSQTATDNPARDVFGRKLNSNAWPIGPVRQVVSGAADQTYPSIASLTNEGGYLVAWEERLPGQAPDIRVRRLNRNGIAYGTSYALAGGPPFSFAPDLASTGIYSTLVVWLDRNAASDHSILATEVNRDGRRVGPERMIVQGGTGPSAVTPVIPPVPGFPTPPGPPVLPTP